MRNQSTSLENAGGKIVKSHNINHIIESLKNQIAYQMESRFDLWGAFLDKKENAVIYLCPSLSIVVQNVGDVTEFIGTLKQHSDKGVNEGIDDRFVYYSWFYNCIEPYFIPDVNPQRDLQAAFELADPIGSLEFDIASILNSIHRINRDARIRTRIVIGEDIPPLSNRNAFMIFKEKDGRKTFKLEVAPNVDFYVEKDSTIPEKYIIPGEVYECSLRKSSSDTYYIDVLRRAGKGKLGINFNDEEPVFDRRICPDLNNFSCFHDDLLITTQSIKKSPEFKDKRLTVVHVGTEEFYDILISFYRMGFRKIEISIPRLYDTAIIINSHQENGLSATAVLGTRDYKRFGYQRG